MGATFVMGLANLSPQASLIKFSNDFGEPWNYLANS